MTPRKPARYLDLSSFRPPKTRKKTQTDLGAASSESPALRGFVGERGRFATTSLYLVLLSNRWVSAKLAIAGGKAVNPCALFSLCACVKKTANSASARRGGIRTLGLRFALPKNPGPGVTGAYFPFYACRRRSVDAAIFAPKKQQIPHQRDGGGITTLGARRVLPKPCAATGQEGILCRFTRSALPLLE